MTIPEEAKVAARLAVLENYGRIDCPPFLLTTLNGFAHAALTAAAPHLAAVRVNAQPNITRPIVGIENRTAQEVFDIMRDRILSALEPSAGRAAVLEEAARLVETHAYTVSNAGPRLEPSKMAKDDQHHATIAAAIRALTYQQPDKLADRSENEPGAQREHALHPVADKPDEAGAQGEVTTAARDVLAERSRQIEAEGWTPEHDDQHKAGELAKAATCYASVYPLAASYWPWDLKWWKPSDRRRNLVKAGALIIAEIERLDRLPTPPSSEVS